MSDVLRWPTPTVYRVGPQVAAVDLTPQQLLDLRCELLLAAPPEGEAGRDEMLALARSLAPGADQRVHLTRTEFAKLVRVLCISTITRRNAHTYPRRVALARELLPVLGPTEGEAVRAECRMLLSGRKHAQHG
jgi:hypothetical protein